MEPETLWEIYLYEEDFGAQSLNTQLQNVADLSARGELTHFPVKLMELRPPNFLDIDWEAHAVALTENLECDEEMCTENGGPTISISGADLMAFCLPTLNLDESVWIPTGKEKVIYRSKAHYFSMVTFPNIPQKSEEDRIEAMRKEVAEWDEKREHEPMGDY
jgi:hypothetical protein